MKKRILSLFIVLTLLLSLMPTSYTVAAEDLVSTDVTDTYTTAVDDPCPCGCGLELVDVNWMAYDPNNGALENGHYYLEDNYVQKGQYNIHAGESIVLDLRGHTLTTIDYSRLYKLNGYLAVLDSVGGGKLCSKTAGNGYGSVIMIVKDGSTNAVFELYSGTLTLDQDNKGGRRGGLIWLGSNSTFNMYGGIVMNGTSEGEEAEEGGCIAATATTSVIRIEGGRIIGGYAPSHGGNIYSNGGTTILKNCEIISGRSGGNGGNIYQSGGSLTIENCEIAHGISTGSYGGGNISTVSDAKVVIRDSLICNGYAAKQGGNMYLASGIQTIENTTVESGVCGTYGGNLRMTSKAVTTLNNCEIAGDVSVAGTLNLQGATKIGLNNNGLNLMSSGETISVSAAGLTEGAEIFVNAGALFTEAGVKAEYFKPAMRTVITETADGLMGSQAAGGEAAGYCPHCNQMVDWQAFSTTGSLQKECYLDGSSDTNSACTGKHIATGHYYLTESYTSFAQMYAGAVQGDKTANADVVVDLNGYSITASSRPFYIKKSGTLTLLDSIGGSVVTGKGVADQPAGVIYNEGGNLNVYGGKYTFARGKAVTNGGIIYSSGVINIFGGVFDASAYSSTGYSGGVIYLSTGASRKLNITTGYFKGGTAKTAGTLYIGANCKVKINGGHFTGGSAVESGGNINVVGTTSNNAGTILISGATITDGHSDANAGNMQITYYKEVNVVNSYIARGDADTYAGNINLFSNSTFMKYEDCIIADGTAGTYGGNLYASNTTTTARFTNCMIVGGYAAQRGGNLSIHHGRVEFAGGAIASGVSAENGGNIYASVGNHESGSGHYLSLDGGVQITGGSAKKGGNLFCSGIVNLQNAFLHGGKANESGSDIYLTKGSLRTALTFGENATGHVSMYVAEALMGDPVYGSSIDGTVATVLNIQVELEGEYGQLQLGVMNGKLAVPSVILVGNGTVLGYSNVMDAVADCKQGQYVKLYTDATMNLDGDVTVDLNGHTVAVTGTGTFYGMDSMGTGKVCWAEGIHVAEVSAAPDGKTYIGVTEGTESTYHVLDMAITGVAIRPSASGIYYTDTWSCDDVLKDHIASYGVAVDTVAVPNSDFMTNGNSLYTSFEPETLTSGANKTGAIISNILSKDRSAEINSVYGKMPIFAASYIKLKSGTTIMSSGVGYSLYDVMCMVEQNAYADNQGKLEDFYNTWKTDIEDWEFKYLNAGEEYKVLDGKKVLFVGDSFLFYGRAVLPNTKESEAARQNDTGYFYQLCKANGADVSVTNWTYGGTGLAAIMDTYIPNFQEYSYDYVILSGGRNSATTYATLSETLDRYIEVFRGANPNVKIFYLVTSGAHNISVNESFSIDVLNNLDKIEEKGITVLDWGKMVADIIRGNVRTPGATMPYEKNSFIVAKSSTDGYHPNQLTGYIVSLFVYCGITGDSALWQPYGFWDNSEFDPDGYLNTYYTLGTSNYQDIFNSPEDMRIIQMLVDQYMAEKAYLSYNFTEVPKN